MYDEIVKTVSLTYDEIEIILDVLNIRKEMCVSLSETITIDELIDKFSKK